MSEKQTVAPSLTKTSKPSVQHLLGIEGLALSFVQDVLARAEHLLTAVVQPERIVTAMPGKIIAPLFFEASTRTRHSFEIAALRLGAILLPVRTETSSIVKGESVLDTVKTLEALGVRYFIIRHANNGLPAWIADQVNATSHVINAGDGANEHPTQALLDLLTIQQVKPRFQSLIVAIVGDIVHSRVAHSLTQALFLMGVPEVRWIGPASLLPEEIQPPGVRCFERLEQGLGGADVIVTLRLQQERAHFSFDTNWYSTHFGLTETRLKLAKPGAIVLHPGPVNRDVEIDAKVLESSQSLIQKQVRNGVAVRMAVLQLLGEAKGDAV